MKALLLVLLLAGCGPRVVLDPEQWSCEEVKRHTIIGPEGQLIETRECVRWKKL